MLRWGTIVVTLALGLVAALTVALTADFLLNLSPLARAIALIVICAGMISLLRRRVSPWLSGRETITDAALEVERRNPAARDLVAAVQFQSEEATTWGSSQLKHAVISAVDEASRDLDLFTQFSWKPLPGRLALFGGAMAGLLFTAVCFPQHASIALQRLLLADVSYPTQTIITSVIVNGTEFDPADVRPLRIAAGSPVTFAVSVSGTRPATSSVILTDDDGGATSVELHQPTAEPERDYEGILESFREPLAFVVSAGDARTPSRRLELVPRPMLTLDLVPTPPEYARSNAPAAPPPGVRTAFVLEGSDVAIRIHAVNKPLSSVSLTLAEQPANGDHASTASRDFPLKSAADDRTWFLDPAGTPFEDVRQPITFTVAATDQDGLAPAEPIVGSIRLRSDRTPRVTASAVVRKVLPAAKPVVTYEASDDFGLQAMRALMTIRRSDGALEEAEMPLPLEGTEVQAFQGRHALDLSGLNLMAGDRIVVTVEAQDTRGDRPGETGTAEPITLEVTDRTGLLTTLLQTDEESADRLDAIIRQELGIGGDR